MLRYSFSCITVHLSHLQQQHLSLTQTQPPVVRSYGGSETRCYTKDHHGNNGREGKGSIRKEENGNILQLYKAWGPAAQTLTKEVATHKQELNDDCRDASIGETHGFWWV